MIGQGNDSEETMWPISIWSFEEPHIQCIPYSYMWILLLGQYMRWGSSERQQFSLRI